MSPKSKAKPEDMPKASRARVVQEDEYVLSADEQRQFLVQLRLKQTQIPPYFLSKTFQNFETRNSTERKQLLMMAKHYVQNFGDPANIGRPGAILHGATGSGKTHIVCAILHELILRGHRALFYSVPDFLKSLRDTISNPEKTQEEILSEAAQVKVLALDDLGAEKTSDFTMDRLYWIINERYCNNRATLVTTNYSWPDDLEKAVGARITSRLAEMCENIGPFPNEDWRMKNAGLKRRIN